MIAVYYRRARRLAMLITPGWRREHLWLRVLEVPGGTLAFAVAAEVICDEKPFEFSITHDLAVQETLLLASGMPRD
jgi:hypothetical protein